MKKTLAIVALLALVASPAIAEDGKVSQSALASLGLGGMEVVSDDVGMQVRGMASSAATNSFSYFSIAINFNNGNISSTFTFNGGGGLAPASESEGGVGVDSQAMSNSAGGFDVALDIPLIDLGVEVFRFQISTFSFGGGAMASSMP